ncbi:MAG: hypothetical protein IJI27_09360 [Oscillospiraceae bacterium]|nr:hypothetical protein [Oscillospiraceae bacterium]
MALMIVFALCACGHQHTWAEASCTEPKTCAECGATEGEALGHSWKDASCTEPKTCTVCGATEGEALGHSWKDATCTEPKTCAVCGATEGEALGHDVGGWEVVKQASCSETGLEEGKCSRCGEKIQREIGKLEHTPGDWTVLTNPTPTSDGVKVISCKVCGEELQRESFSLSPEEIKALYIKECRQIAYKDLERKPGEYEGQKIRISGRVVQVCSEASSALYYSTYRVATAGTYANVIYVKIDNYGSGTRILEGDFLKLYGTFDGLYTYKAVRGNSITIPSMTAEYVD